LLFSPLLLRGRTRINHVSRNEHRVDRGLFRALLDASGEVLVQEIYGAA
jgi:hypothetical protein